MAVLIQLDELDTIFNWDVCARKGWDSGCIFIYATVHTILSTFECIPERGGTLPVFTCFLMNFMHACVEGLQH